MGKIYVGQTALQLVLTTSVDVHDAACYIKHKKPDGSMATWSGVISDPDTGVFYYNIQPNDLDQAGDWILWSHVIFPNSTVAIGEPNTIEVYAEGK